MKMFSYKINVNNGLWALICILSVNEANAAYRHFLFAPATPVIIQGGTIELNDYTASINVDATGGPDGIMSGKVLMANCSGGNNSDSATQDKTEWLIVPKKIEMNGISVYMEILNNNGWKNPGPSVPTGYDGKVNQRTVNRPLGECWRVGSYTQVDFFWRNAMVKLTVPKQQIKPGAYNITIPYYYGYEENKYIGDPANASSIPSKIMNAGSSGTINMRVNVLSKCDINTAPVNLLHGSMTPDQAYRNVTRPYNINLTCNSNTSVSVKLLGVTPVSGKTANFTRCGDSGNCELTFNNGLYDEVINVSGNTNLAITSTFHPSSGTPIDGTFSGNAILQIIVN